MTRQSTLPSLREQARHALLLLGVPAPARLVVDVHAAFFDGDLSVPALAALMREDERAHAERPRSAAAPPRAEPAPSPRASHASPGEPAPSPRASHAPPGEPAPSPRASHASPAEPAGSPLAEPSLGEGRSLSDGRSLGGRATDAAGPLTDPDGAATASATHPARGEDGTLPRPYLICPALQQDLTPARGIVTLSTWSLDERLSTPAVARAHALVATVRIAEFAAVCQGASAGAHELLRRLAADVPGGPESLDLAAAARAALDAPALAATAAAEEPARTEALSRAELLDDHRRLFGLPSVPHQRGGA
ncbi:hypothetical protein [Actinoplanes sp. NPDC049265]|uniref:hypothetical protein n=1 Tax=Actinoplanes sp. NPDC049265 TaxID=3363902 RepID=UPI00371A8D31